MDASRGTPARRLAAALVVLVLAGSAPRPATAAEWTVRSLPRTDGQSGVRCVLESSRQALSDGYQTTTAWITVDSRSVAVSSVSNLDGSFGDVGLVVDQQEMVPMDRLGGDKTALFDSHHARIVEQFKAGIRVRVQLRFWPTWPATGPHSVTFSLIGFTRAYGELSGCS
jgi:hypothetical protein